MFKNVSIYVDESIHSGLNFIATAYVATIRDIEIPVRDALLSHRLTPGHDEFKSGTRMSTNPEMRNLRESLFDIVNQQTRLALLVSPATERHTLGAEVLRQVPLMCARNRLDPTTLRLFLDSGILSKPSRNEPVAVLKDLGIDIRSEQDSKVVLGLQVADAVAHLCSQVIRQELTGEHKIVDVGGPNSGYAPGTEADLGWALLTRIRYAFFTQPWTYSSGLSSEHARSDARVIASENDLDAVVDAQLRPRLLGWGVLFSNAIDPNLRDAVEHLFSSIWLGCIH